MTLSANFSLGKILKKKEREREEKHILSQYLQSGVILALMQMILTI